MTTDPSGGIHPVRKKFAEISGNSVSSSPVVPLPETVPIVVCQFKGSRDWTPPTRRENFSGARTTWQDVIVTFVRNLGEAGRAPSRRASEKSSWREVERVWRLVKQPRPQPLPSFLRTNDPSSAASNYRSLPKAPR